MLKNVRKVAFNGFYSVSTKRIEMFLIEYYIASF